jgi:hypothetical protein
MNKFFSKYSQVGSCSEFFISIKSMVQSEFNFDTRFMIYRFLNFKQLACKGDINTFVRHIYIFVPAVHITCSVRTNILFW